MTRQIIDLTGQRFARLVVLGRAADRPKSGGGRVVFWRALCDCGDVVEAPRARLIDGQTRSCGCLARELSSARLATVNRRGNRKNVVTYTGAHYRVRKAKGRASDHSCACGQPAKHWAYTHEDAGELSEARFNPGYPKPIVLTYSTDPAFYVPMCRLCHKAFDRAHRAAVAS